MRFALQVCSWVIGLPLELLVIAAMLRGAFRQYPVLFAYAIADFLLTIAGMPSYIAFFSGDAEARTSIAQWFLIDELLLQPLIYAAVIGLIYRAAEEKMRSRRITSVGLIAGAAMIALISFLIHYNPHVPRGVWISFWSRDLTFCASILDLALWALLLASRRRDICLLMVSGGLGIQFTGEAIGESLRAISTHYHSITVAMAGSILTTLADLGCLYVFWHAFRRTAGEPTIPAASATAHRK